MYPLQFFSDYLKDYNYYNKPDGQDPCGKIIGLSKYALATGSFAGVYDACLYSKCQTAGQFFNTAGYWLVPLTGMAVSFSSVTYIMTKIRKKDDFVNYIAGAMSAGAILHAWQKSYLMSGWGTFFFVVYGVLRQDLEKNKDRYEQKNLIMPNDIPHRWYFPWRNVPYRDYTKKPYFELNRESYYKNF